MKRLVALFVVISCLAGTTALYAGDSCCGGQSSSQCGTATSADMSKPAVPKKIRKKAIKKATKKEVLQPLAVPAK
jgi:hypothetical protein